jgi:hypothetical protein
VTEAVNDTLKAIAASLLMEQVLAPRFRLHPKRPTTAAPRVSTMATTATIPTNAMSASTMKLELPDRDQGSDRAARVKKPKRICREDLNEVIAAFVQDKPAIERGLFDEELVPEELTQVRMGKIVKEKFPELSDAGRPGSRAATCHRRTEPDPRRNALPYSRS